MKQTILVTGGTGFIGSHTTVELQQAGYNVVIVDNLSNSKIEVLDGIEKITGIRPAFEQVDLRDLEATEEVFKKYPDIEGIIHFAASKAVGESVEKPLLYYRNNITSLINLLEMMLLFVVYGLWAAIERKPSCHRECSDTKGSISIRKHKANQRGNNSGLCTFRSTD